MANKKDKKTGLLSVNVTVADNRRARFDYILEDKFEVGIMLVGTEVKSLRHGQCSLNEAYVGPHKGEIWLHNCYIPEYFPAGPNNQHEPKRLRRLLMKKKEMDRLMGAVSREGYTIIPTRLYFNGRGLAKLEIALAKGKQLHDKRETQKNRDWDRQKGRIMRDKG
ncbi:MAG: SsrA-binding protein SmpB [Alphaproteobacteria bacterium]|nr:SsrA-binding protein SmpB [Alphaproteobacteria bacterium]MBU0859925.1 SsrA-binding protein SmpB [Alphaproteobacteria bacterium]